MFVIQARYLRMSQKSLGKTLCGTRANEFGDLVILQGAWGSSGCVEVSPFLKKKSSQGVWGVVAMVTVSGFESPSTVFFGTQCPEALSFPSFPRFLELSSSCH